MEIESSFKVLGICSSKNRSAQGDVENRVGEEPETFDAMKALYNVMNLGLNMVKKVLAELIYPP